MLVRERSKGAIRAIGSSGTVEVEDRPSLHGRLIPILLTLYLTPALLVVLLVGGIGMLVLGIARGITTLLYGPEAWPSGPVGPDRPPAISNPR